MRYRPGRSGEEQRGYEDYGKPFHSRYEGGYDYGQGWDEHARDDRRERERREEEREMEEAEARRHEQRVTQAAQERQQEEEAYLAAMGRGAESAICGNSGNEVR